MSGEFEQRMARLAEMAQRLREIQEEAQRERASVSPSSNPRLEAAMSKLAREVGEAADVADTLTTHPDLVSA